MLRFVLALILLLAAAVPALAGESAAPVQPPAIDKPLVAHWTFDEAFGEACQDASGNGHEATPARPASLKRVQGVFGAALEFKGRHMLRVPGKPDFSKVERIALCAWTKPSAFERYTEIFRKEDGDQRVLFAFQENMRVLSLGLNVGGYIECDAKITPKQVMDGQWHHCAATFDGKVMRVYLDGQEIGSLKRPGTITGGGSAPGCIGSSNGGECFQGTLDDLRIYAEPLTAQEVARICDSGADALLRHRKGLAEKLQAVYAPRKTLAATLAATRQSLVEQNVALTHDLAQAILRKLRGGFADECARFARTAQGAPLACLLAKDRKPAIREAQRLIGMATEYKPLTDEQWKRLPPDQDARWKKVEAMEQRLAALEKQSDPARFADDWMQIILTASPLIEERPTQREAVAPYRTPSTPETRDLTAEQARATLERDWLHQAGNRPTPQRIQQEIGWAREMAARIEASHRGEVDLAKDLAALAALEKQAAALKKPDRELYFKVREVKRRILFANPVVDFDKVLFVDMPYPAGSEWPHEARHMLGYMAVPGARLLVLEGLSPAGHLRQLMPQPPLHGSFWRPDLSWDAKQVVASFKPHNEKSFHLYEINADGTGLAQLTDGPYDDFDPIYLPDEDHIIFSTTRGHTWVRCMPPTSAFILARCGRDGRNIYLISRGNEPDYTPSVMNDGRVIYTRWEYTDKPLWRCQSLWTMNPDGTQVNAFWGNQSVWPDLLKDARSIPGSRRVMFTGSAHHNWFSGSVAILDPDKGFNFPHGLTKVTADVAYPESGNGPVDPIESPRYHASGAYGAYYSPYPLSETDFIVSANRGGKFLLLLMDVDGNRELIYEGTHNIFHAQPLKARPRPRVIEDRVAWPTREERLKPKPGTIYSNNVYEGAPEVLRGKARYLRILNIDRKTYTYWYKRPYLSSGPVVSGIQSEGVKRVIGTVPIEEDGSVHFTAPSGLALHFQLLDGRYRALQTMRSFSGVMPGERRGCLGCHELHSVTPDVGDKSIAASKPPRAITPPPWGDETVSYPRFVRSVLDKYCAKCHTGEGKGRAKLDLTPKPGRLGFDQTYWLFTGNPSWGKAYVMPKNPPPGFGIADMIMVEGYDQRDPVAYATPPPMTKLSYKSRLIERASSGKHHDVKVDAVSLRRLIAWVDAMCPYRGVEEVREIPDPEFQGIDWLAVRPRIKTAPIITRPGPVD